MKTFAILAFIGAVAVLNVDAVISGPCTSLVILDCGPGYYLQKGLGCNQTCLPCPVLKKPIIECPLGASQVRTQVTNQCPTWSCQPAGIVSECQTICANPVIALDSIDSASCVVGGCQCGCPVDLLPPSMCPAAPTNVEIILWADKGLSLRWPYGPM